MSGRSSPSDKVVKASLSCHTARSHRCRGRASALASPQTVQAHWQDPLILYYTTRAQASFMQLSPPPPYRLLSHPSLLILCSLLIRHVLTHRRLLHAFRRAQTSVSTSTQTDPLSTDPNSPARAVFDTAGPSRVNPYLNYNPQGLSPKALGKQPCRAFLCFDVEATCRGGKEFSWPNEIIVSVFCLASKAVCLRCKSGMRRVNMCLAGPLALVNSSNRMLKYGCS